MGKAALEGQPGISRVTKGWSQSREINTVFYDADKISTDQMVVILKKAGTYQGIAVKPRALK
ncbi:MAG: hypothetical protein K9K66_05180 [Desulfarculaceae bacterium]|nr:hypothetical protein [Desulfarculaceae bacterium]MCF8072866.1 hypothetical protein [Desulfarculaceae bacterium]MCF8101034.1 hypothetical protein [Desulfarculaceae bacterium]MCF8115579.1 hypothetical protein [Desulfarculaceae bacterium]